MSTITATRPSVNPGNPTVAPLWDPNQLPYGARVTLLEFPGVHRVVREAQMGNDGHFRVRVREVAENGSLVGPVRSVRPRDVAAILAVEASVPPVAAPAPVPVGFPAAVAVETADTFTPPTSRRRHEAVRAFPALYHLGQAEAAVKAGSAEWLTDKPAAVKCDEM